MGAFFDRGFREEELTRAAALVHHSMAAALPIPESCNPVFSEDFEQKMAVLIGQERIQAKRRRHTRWAAVFVLLLTLSFAVSAVQLFDFDASAFLFSWNQRFDEVCMAENSEGIGILRYGNRLVHLTDDDQLLDLYTGEPVCVLPQSWLDRFPWINAVTFGPDGHLWLARYEDSTGMLLIEHDPEGIMPDREVLLPQWKGRLQTGEDGLQYSSVRKFIVTEDFVYLLCMEDSYDKRLQVFTHDGKLHMEALTSDFEVDADGCFYTTGSDNQVHKLFKFDPYTKEMVYAAESRWTERNWRVFQMALDPDTDDLYLLMNEQIERYSAKTGQWQESCMQRAGNMLLCETELVRTMLVDQGTIYLKAGMDIYRYDAIDGDGAAIEPTLTLRATHRDSLVMQAIGLYEKAHPGTRIRYEYLYDSLQAYRQDADVVRQQKLESLYGAAEQGEADLILVPDDAVPALEKAQLASFVPDETADGTLLKALNGTGEITMVPLAVYDYYIEGNRTLAAQLGIPVDSATRWSDVFALYPQVDGSDHYLFSAASKREVLAWFLRSNADPETGMVDLRDPALQAALHQLKAIWNAPNFFMYAEETIYTDLKPHSLFCLSGFNEYRALADQYWDYYNYRSRSGGEMMLLPMFAGETGTSRPVGSSRIALLPAGGASEKAADLLRFMLDRQVQSSSLLRDRAMHTAAFAARMQDVIGDSDRPREQALRFTQEYRQITDSVSALYREEVLPDEQLHLLMDFLNDQ